MYKIIPLVVISFVLAGALLCSCESKITDPPICDTCDVPCDTCDTTIIPCDTCDTTVIIPCDTCDTTKGDPDSLAHAFTWTEYSIPGEPNLTGCWVFNDNLIYAMGAYLYKFNGSVWIKEKVTYYTPDPVEGYFADYSLFCNSPNDMWMVKGVAFNYKEGKGYRLYPPAPGPRACWGTSSNDMFFVGDNGYISHYDGTTFTKFPQVTTKNLRSVWGTSHNDVWAAGFNSSTAETVLLHYNGSSWTEDPLSVEKGLYASGGFNSVWACDSAGQKFVTTSGAILLRKTGSGAWRSDSGFVPNRNNDGTFIGIAPFGNSPNDMFVVGGWGFVAHWNGKTWKRYDELFNYGNPNYGAAALHVKGNTACVVGTKGGKSWIAIGRRKL